MIAMFTAPVRHSGFDTASCTWSGQDFAVRSRSACAALARKLVAAGCPDQPWQAYTETGTPSLRGGSLHALAQLAVQEHGGRLAWRPWRDFHGLEAD